MAGLSDLTDSLSVLQDAITSRLQGVAAFNGYTVRSETDGEIDDLVAKPQGKYKLLVTVALPDLARGSRRSSRKALVTIEFEEAVKLNRATPTFKTARSLAMEAQNALVDWSPGGAWSAMDFEDERTITQRPTFIKQLVVSTEIQLS